MPIGIRRPGPERLNRVLRDVAGRPLTYPEIGATRDETMPDGYHSARRSIELGHGETAFESGVAALRAWRAHASAGETLTPVSPAIEVGVELVGVLRSGPLWLIVLCRIVYVIDEPRRFGFAYGTLPGHPETGEESFLIEMAPDGAVTCTISFFSRLTHPLARVGSPVAWRLQRAVTERYLRGVKEFVDARR